MCLSVARKRERVRQGKMSSGEEDEDDDEKWYTQEVGVAPDPGECLLIIIIDDIHILFIRITS